MAKTTHVLFICLCLASLLSCSNKPLPVTSPAPEPSTVITVEIPPVTPVPTTTESIPSIRPGVILTDDLKHLPLPTSGYDLYVVGEPHGQKEARDLTFAYLLLLYEQAGTRGIILEQIPPVLEREVNAYVMGERDMVSNKWSPSADILIDIRKFNDQLADEDKIHVYLTDLDFTLPSIYAHLKSLNSQEPLASAEIHIPMLSELKIWEEEKMLTLVDEMKSVAGDRQDVVVALETVEDSIRWHFVTSMMENGEMLSSEFIPHERIREQRISINARRILAEQDGRPVLALYGGYHAQKTPTMVVNAIRGTFFLDAASWVQHTVEAGINVYSVFAMGLSGQEGMNTTYQQAVEKNPGEIRFSDGMTGAELLAARPGDNILYIDLRVEENYGIRFGNDFLEVDAGKIFDGAVFFREVHPQEWEQYP
jgi:hypothetical protein